MVSLSYNGRGKNGPAYSFPPMNTKFVSLSYQACFRISFQVIKIVFEFFNTLTLES